MGKARIAYFSMEVALHPAMPTYSGGLGILAGDMLRALGHDGLRRFHVNEGHASLLPLALLEERARKAGRAAIAHEDIEAVRAQSVFTTHTPVPAGHGWSTRSYPCSTGATRSSMSCGTPSRSTARSSIRSACCCST